MIVVCPNCQTKYRVVGTEASLAGRRMRCKQCKHEWTYGSIPDRRERQASRAQHPKVKHDELYVSALKLKSTRQLRRERRGFGLVMPKLSTLFFLIPLGLLVLGAGLTWLLFQDYWVQGWPAIARSYEAVGIYPTEGCTVHSFYVLRDKDEIAINGVVENTAEDRRRMPALKISVFFKAEGDQAEAEQAKAEPQMFIVPSNGEWLAPHQKYFFYEKIVPLNQNIERITVEVVNFLDQVVTN